MYSEGGLHQLFLVSTWITDRQSRKSEIARRHGWKSHSHAVAQWFQLASRKSRNSQWKRYEIRVMPNSPTRITQELELANINHAKRWLQNLPTRIDHITARIPTLKFSWRTIEWWHRRNQAPKIKVGRSRRLSPTPCSLLFLVGFTNKERPKCTESKNRLMILPNRFVPLVC